MKTMIMMLILSALTVGAIPSHRAPVLVQVGRKLQRV